MFEVNKTYRNRKGTYKVISTMGPKMKIQYEDGEIATVNMRIQARIWENIVAEQEEADNISRKRQSAPCYIKTINLLSEDLTIRGLTQRITGARINGDPELPPNTRLIYYGIESMVFFAVVTITSPPRSVKAKGYLDHLDHNEMIYLYPIDVEAHTRTVDTAISIDTVDLESVPNFKKALQIPNQFISVSEDDFELLAERLAEQTEEEEGLDGFDDDDDDDELDLD
ncbi:MAG TPA: hypothetical protein VLL52_23855 [Anaerolineae bacterium]|nr:hypothetical protein [Anaerolineae bacterium]